jgi:hypothetical protein
LKVSVDRESAQIPNERSPGQNRDLHLESTPGAVQGQIDTMLIAEAGEAWRGAQAKGVSGCGSQCRACENLAVIGKADQAAIERRVPRCR